MSSHLYILVENRYFLHGHIHKSFGIALVEEEDADVTILQTVCDLSPDRRRVMELAALCNRLQPSKEQLSELIEEFLG